MMMPSIADRCMRGLMQIVSASTSESVVAQAVIVMRFVFSSPSSFFPELFSHIFVLYLSVQTIVAKQQGVTSKCHQEYGQAVGRCQSADGSYCHCLGHW
jgi:hypothetical protein